MEDFDAYVAVAWPRLLRSAWVLTGDWHRPRQRDGSPDAYLSW